MKHRLVNNGFGANAEVLLDNKGDLSYRLDMVYEATTLFFQEWEGCDFNVEEEYISLGVEPTYQYDKLKIMTITKDKKASTYQTGKAWGAYGSQLVKKEKRYSDYKRKSKFVRFVDKWHPVLFPNTQGDTNGKK